ncbi:MAG: polysaccharide deacetylase family protein [Armatimonadota bacterium]|nr:polysaccharide deacetylase family protein [Armatimonadota bacterium]MCX7777373.1 polysaccharide deacetylase family protein [Armatimonadota bacterium]MDW8025359.1 polysaccharide deacetylase family protein [Armatimonadota bacterium]
MLNALGFKFLTMSEAVEIMRGRWDKPIPKRPVVITIDDGFRSAYKIAYPLLSKHGAKATLFIYTNAVGRFGLSWGQLKEMVQSGRIEVASHTVTHTNPNSLKKRLSPDDYRERLVYEFIASKRLLEHKLGVKVNGLAYTCGIVDSVAMEIARAAGYKWAVTIAPKPFTPHTNPYRIPRYGVSNSTTVLVLRKWLTSKTFAFAQLSHPMNCKVSH